MLCSNSRKKRHQIEEVAVKDLNTRRQPKWRISERLQGQRGNEEKRAVKKEKLRTGEDDNRKGLNSVTDYPTFSGKKNEKQKSKDFIPINMRVNKKEILSWLFLPPNLWSPCHCITLNRLC